MACRGGSGSVDHVCEEVQQLLKPFYAKKQMRWRTYGELVYGWLVLNQAPHTNWDGERIPASHVAPPASLI